MKNRHQTLKLPIQGVLLFLLVFALADDVTAQAISFIARREFLVGESPRSVAIGDFNRDKIQDLALVVPNNVAILVGHGDGTFKEALTFAMKVCLPLLL